MGNIKKSFGVSLLMFCLVYLVGCDMSSIDLNKSRSVSETSSNNESSSLIEIESISSSDEAVTTDDSIQDIVDRVNDLISVPLVFVEDFVPSDKSSSHYRTEFRLSAYNNAIGKSYSFENATVDIIGRETYFKSAVIRIYMSNATLENCLDVIEAGSLAMDPTITNDIVQETLDYVRENKEANGYYYSQLDLLLLNPSHSDTGYELMLKMRND